MPQETFHQRIAIDPQLVNDTDWDMGEWFRSLVGQLTDTTTVILDIILVENEG